MCTNLKFCAGRLIPCGKCEECLKVKRITEYNRIRYEYDDCAVAYHITLTYARLRDFDGFADIRDFIKNLRKEIGDCSYYAVYEEGELRGRPHFHILVFLNKQAYLGEKCVSDSWKNGFIRCRIIKKLREVRYLTNYLFKKYGKKNIRNFSSSNNFGYNAFLRKYFSKEYLVYLSGEIPNADFVGKYFDSNFHKKVIDKLYYGTWRYLPRCWKEKYYKLVNSLLGIVDLEALRLFYYKTNSLLLQKQELSVRYFDRWICNGNNSANGYAYFSEEGYKRNYDIERTYKLAGIFYSIFVPQFGLKNLNGCLLEYFKYFAFEYLDYFILDIAQAPKEWCDESRRMQYLRENRCDFLGSGNCGRKYFGVHGVFSISSDYLNNVVFI